MAVMIPNTISMPQKLIDSINLWRTPDTEYTGISGDEQHLEWYHRRKKDDISILTRVLFPNVWLITTILLLVIIAKQKDGSTNPPTQAGNYADGFGSDFDEAKAAIKLEQRRFTHAIRDHENGTLYTFSDQEGPKYVGSPSAEIDEAWAKLLYGRYFRLKAIEVDQLNQDTYVKNVSEIIDAVVKGGSPSPPPLPSQSSHPTTKPKDQDEKHLQNYFGEPDMFHSLHCVNELRKTLDMDYYGDKMRLPPEFRRMHIEHCVEQLRQAIMCHGDLTPVTLKPVMIAGDVRYFLGETERMHTCRDARALREWLDQRGRETGFLGYV